MTINIRKLLDKPVMFYVMLFVLLVVIFYKPIKLTETFLTWGEYTRDTNYPLLYEDYPLKKKHYKQVSRNDYSDNYEYYPIYSADSLKINNLRYWKTPDNGKCSTAEFCNVLYDEKPMQDVKVFPPQPEWGRARVNYYGSNADELS
jgi:hypothetical protein